MDIILLKTSRPRLLSLISTLSLILFFTSYSFGQVENEEFYKSDTVNSGVKNIEMLWLPIVFYTPETSFGIGGGIQLFYNNKKSKYNGRKSNILITAIYTVKNQLMIDVKPQLYFNNGRSYLDGVFRYKVFPNSFWGIGINTPDSAKESYNMRTVNIQTALMWRLTNSTNLGFDVKFENNTMLEIEEGKQLDSANILGSRDAKINGLLAVYNIDNRDNIYSPKKGIYFQFKAGGYLKIMGSTYEYAKISIDFRQYIPIKKRSVLAYQVYEESNLGDVPFQGMAWLGGGERTRGYFRGRYIDKQFTALQIEYRWRFKDRWGLSGFVSAGEVTDNISDYLSDVKWSYGGGLRFQVKKNNPTLVRFDIGVNKFNEVLFYFGVNEAF